MKTKRKVLTVVFLILFLFGGLAALGGEVAGALVYWFLLGVVFTAPWFLLGPGTNTSTESAPRTTPKAIPASLQISPLRRLELLGYVHLTLPIQKPEPMTPELEKAAIAGQNL